MQGFYWLLEGRLAGCSRPGVRGRAGAGGPGGQAEQMDTAGMARRVELLRRSTRWTRTSRGCMPRASARSSR